MSGTGWLLAGLALVVVFLVPTVVVVAAFMLNDESNEGRWLP